MGEKPGDSTKGPGKYGKLADYLLLATDAQCAIAIILEGTRGSGFSVAMVPKFRSEWTDKKLAAMLRGMADQVETRRIT